MTSFESIVLVFIFIFFNKYQANSCIAPKWHAQPQKKRPKIRVNPKANKTNNTPELITPNFKKE